MLRKPYRWKHTDRKQKGEIVHMKEIAYRFVFFLLARSLLSLLLPLRMTFMTNIPQTEMTQNVCSKFSVSLLKRMTLSTIPMLPAAAAQRL